MSDPQKVHVMTLAPEMQLAFRIILSNQLKRNVKLIFDYMALNHSRLRDTQQVFTATEDKCLKVIKAINIYDELVGDFPTPRNVEQAQNRMFMFNNSTMTHIALAIENFRDDERIGMADDEIEFASQFLTEVRDLFQESKKYEYTVDEIRAAMRRA